MWHNQLPSWVSNGQFTAADLTTVIQNHCGTVVGHYKGQVCEYSIRACMARVIVHTLRCADSWDVVNGELTSALVAVNMVADPHCRALQR